MLRGIRALMILLSCLGMAGAQAAEKGTINMKEVGKSKDGRAIDIFTLRNASGAEVRITNLGGTIMSIKVPDKSGKIGEVTVGNESPDDMPNLKTYAGALIGRYANRIALGKFTLGGKSYTLATNNGPNHLHGGVVGFNQVLWEAKVVETPASPTLELTYLSKDGEEGYPGNLHVKAVYAWSDANELRLDMTATTDKDTVVNMTNHAYFNLFGPRMGDLLKYELTINGSRFLPQGPTMVPTGEIKDVAGTAFDFRKPVTIGERLSAADPQVKLCNGYDHTFAMDKKPGELAVIARVFAPESGRVLEMLSTEPGAQFYTCGYLNQTRPAAGERGGDYWGAFAIEPGRYPDSPNHPEFPTTEIKAGETYKHTIVYRFSVQK